MPCDSSYMEPSGKERKLTETATILIYVKNSLGVKLNENDLSLYHAGIYPDLNLADYAVSTLCSLISGMTKDQLNKIIYNAKSKDSRRAADWWEEHQEADRQREQEAKETKETAKLKEKALKKLTAKEREALELD